MIIEIDANGLVPGDILYIGARSVTIGAELGRMNPDEQITKLAAAYPQHTFRLGDHPAHSVDPFTPPEKQVEETLTTEDEEE